MVATAKREDETEVRVVRGKIACAPGSISSRSHTRAGRKTGRVAEPNSSEVLFQIAATALPRRAFWRARRSSASIAGPADG